MRRPIIDWSKVEKDTCQEIVRQAEAYLQGTVQLATSADQRSSAMASVYIASATALIAGLIAAPDVDRAMVIGGVLAAGLFLSGAACCVWATMPVSFWLAGNEPESWYENVALNEPFPKSLGEIADHYQDKIGENLGVISDNAKRFKVGALLGLSAPIFGSLGWLITSCLFSS